MRGTRDIIRGDPHTADLLKDTNSKLHLMTELLRKINRMDAIRHEHWSRNEKVGGEARLELERLEKEVETICAEIDGKGEERGGS